MIAASIDLVNPLLRRVHQHVPRKQVASSRRMRAVAYELASAGSESRLTYRVYLSGGLRDTNEHVDAR